MCIVNAGSTAPCDRKKYFPSDSIIPGKKYAVASNKNEVMAKYKRLIENKLYRPIYYIGDNPDIAEFNNYEWQLSMSEQDMDEEHDKFGDPKYVEQIRASAVGDLVPRDGDLAPRDVKEEVVSSYPVDDDDTDNDDNYDEFGGRRRRRRLTRRKVRKTLARKSRRSKHLNKKRQKKSRRKHRKR